MCNLRGDYITYSEMYWPRSGTSKYNHGLKTCPSVSLLAIYVKKALLNDADGNFPNSMVFHISREYATRDLRILL